MDGNALECLAEASFNDLGYISDHIQMPKCWSGIVDARIAVQARAPLHCGAGAQVWCEEAAGSRGAFLPSSEKMTIPGMRLSEHLPALAFSLTMFLGCVFPTSASRVQSLCHLMVP